MTPTPYDISVRTIRGEPLTLAPYRGKVLLVVNTASRCGFTPQYAGLQEIYTRFRGRGLEILGFPCNQFGNQEPENEALILDFCTADYGVTFPLFAKIEVNGPGTHALYRFLKAQEPDQPPADIPWNFTKFLLDRRGHVVRRFSPETLPQDLGPVIEGLL